jgi:hypothetical protein
MRKSIGKVKYDIEKILCNALYAYIIIVKCVEYLFYLEYIAIEP